MNGGMPLARDVKRPDGAGGRATARSTGLPEVRGFVSERGADGELQAVDVDVRLSGDRGAASKHTVRFSLDDSTATPLSVESSYLGGAGDRTSVRTMLRAVLAATRGLEAHPDVGAVETVADIVAEVADTEPANGELRDSVGVSRGGP